MEFNISNLSEQAMNLVVTYAPKLLGAIVVYIVGNMIIKWMIRSIDKVMEKKNTDASLRPFLKSLLGVLLRALLIISVLGMLGVEMTSFIAILGAAGLAVGMALSGTLQNFAGGVVILLFKPFKVGDFIEAQGYTGVVEKIQIFTTILLTTDNKTVIIPNGPLANGSMINYSSQPTRRVDLNYGIAYGDSVQKARDILKRIISEDERILKDPESFIGLGELADSSVNLTTRVWVKTEDYWPVFFSMNEKVYDAFNAEGISIPFPQMDVHVQK